MARSADRILTTHVGSLVRPPQLVEYIDAIERGLKVDMKAFDALLQQEVNNVVKRQQQAGIDIVSDGEYGKFRSWSFYVLDRLGGIEERDVVAPIGAGKDRTMFPEFYAEYFPTQRLPKRGTVVTVGPVTYKGQAALKKDIEIFKNALKGVDVEGFLPVVAPASAAPFFKNEYYKNEEEALFGFASALREEYKTIVDAGLYVQIDDAFLPYMFDVAFGGTDLAGFRKWAEVRVDALNHALDGLPQEKIRYHICWGSFNTPHVSDVALKDIVDLVLKVKAGAYCIEMGNPRHEHEWRVWEKVKLPRRQEARAGRHQSLDECRGAPRTRGRAARAGGKTRRPRECHGRHGLRIRADAACEARSPIHHVGQARSARRRRAHRDAGTLGQEGGVSVSAPPRSSQTTPRVRPAW
jgi:5-methyltetrahydropteroyltriglutamate--homocysteine methyltransferase